MFHIGSDACPFHVRIVTVNGLLFMKSKIKAGKKNLISSGKTDCSIFFGASGLQGKFKLRCNLFSNFNKKIP